MAAVGLSNNRTDLLMTASGWLMGFVKYILGFPLNLINPDFPFLMDHTGKMIESDLNPIWLMVLNFGIQVMLIHLLLRLIRRSR